MRRDPTRRRRRTRLSVATLGLGLAFVLTACGGSPDGEQVRKGVLAVPVNALLALAEGGYAVEVERDGRRELIGVTTGLFADGQVEVEGDGLRAGDRVVVPA